MTRKTRARAKRAVRAPLMSEVELARLGGGYVAYIRVITARQASKMFPAVQGLPKNGNIFALYGADGTAIALTDSKQAALGHAKDDELEVASVH